MLTEEQDKKLQIHALNGKFTDRANQSGIKPISKYRQKV